MRKPVTRDRAGLFAVLAECEDGRELAVQVDAQFAVDRHQRHLVDQGTD
ncbi:MAG: hypothetical protein RIM84_09845 [Alphaproteobacteria bacterium]